MTGTAESQQQHRSERTGDPTASIEVHVCGQGGKAFLQIEIDNWQPTDDEIDAFGEFLKHRLKSVREEE